MNKNQNQTDMQKLIFNINKLLNESEMNCQIDGKTTPKDLLFTLQMALSKLISNKTIIDDLSNRNSKLDSISSKLDSLQISIDSKMNIDRNLVDRNFNKNQQRELGDDLDLNFIENQTEINDNLKDKQKRKEERLQRINERKIRLDERSKRLVERMTRLQERKQRIDQRKNRIEDINQKLDEENSQVSMCKDNSNKKCFNGHEMIQNEEVSNLQFAQVDCDLCHRMINVQKGYQRCEFECNYDCCKKCQSKKVGKNINVSIPSNTSNILCNKQDQQLVQKVIKNPFDVHYRHNPFLQSTKEHQQLKLDNDIANNQIKKVTFEENEIENKPNMLIAPRDDLINIDSKLINDQSEKQESIVQVNESELMHSEMNCVLGLIPKNLEDVKDFCLEKCPKCFHKE